MAAGAAWALVLLWLGVAALNLAIFSLLPSVAFVFLLPGLVLLTMISWLARTRFLRDCLVDSQPYSTGSLSDIDHWVMANPVEQLIRSLCIWPPCAYLLQQDGPGVVVALGVGFAVARLAFWFGYRRAPALRAFGIAAIFYPSVGVAVLAGFCFLV